MSVVIFAETVTVQQSNDDGSGAKATLQVYRSSPDEVKVGNITFPYYFGQVGTSGGPATVLRAHFTDPADFREVKGGSDIWEQFWTDAGSHKSSDYTVWKVKDSAIPSGFKCLSPFFFQRADDRPAPTDDQVKGMVFVSDRLCKLIDPNNFAWGWNDHGTHADQDVSMAFANDHTGYLAFPSENPTPPTGTWYTLDFDHKDLRLVQTWDQLNASILANTSAALFPRRIIGDGHVLSMPKNSLTIIFNGNYDNFRKYAINAYDCEDFAAEMRAAVARACYDDSLCRDLQVGCFCGMAYLLPVPGKTGGHGQNLYLQADGTCAMFEPQNGTFQTIAECMKSYSFEGVYY